MRQESIRDEHARSDCPFSSSPTMLPISGGGPRAHCKRRAVRQRSCLRRVISGIDWLLRRSQGVFEFSASETCLLRIASIRAASMVSLSDGTTVERGAPILGLHLWNEHLPPLPARGPGFAWVNQIRRQMLWSLKELAVNVESNPDLQNATAFRARIAFASRGRREKMIRIAAKFGFERVMPDHPHRLGLRIHDFFENFWLWGLVWTFNPRSLRRRKLIRQRDELWISKAALLQRFGPGSTGSIGAASDAHAPRNVVVLLTPNIKSAGARRLPAPGLTNWAAG